MSKFMRTFVGFSFLGVTELDLKVRLRLGSWECKKTMEKEVFIDSCWAEEFKLRLNLLLRRN